MDCKYRKKDLCLILTEMIDFQGVHIPESYCYRLCKGDIAGLLRKKWKVEIPSPPDYVDLLEWLKEKLASGEIKRPPDAEERLRRKQQHEKEQAEHNEKLLSQMPKGFKLAKNLIGHLLAITSLYVKTGLLYVTPPWKLARLNECENCPDEKLTIDKGQWRCGKCGCFLVENDIIGGGMADFIATDCKGGHWLKVDAEFSPKQNTL